MGEDRPVFYDVKGRRGRVVGRVGITLAAVVTVLGTLCLVVALFAAPALPSFKHHPAQRPDRPGLSIVQRPTSFAALALRRRLATEVEKEGAKPSSPPGSPVVLGYYPPWEPSALSSLRAHASALTHLAPAWLSLTDDAGLNDDDFRIDAGGRNEEALDICRREGIHVDPVLSNGRDGRFQPGPVRLLVRDGARRAKLFADVSEWLVQHGCHGLHVDFENLDSATYAALPGLLHELWGVLTTRGLRLSVAVEVDNDSVPVAQIASSCDWIVAMLYDEHDEVGSAGPIASVDWFEKRLKSVLEHVPANRVVAGLANYAYDWPAQGPGATAMTYQEAMAMAMEARQEKPSDVLVYDDESWNWTFRYDDDENRPRTVWMLDGVTAFNEWRIAKGSRVRGAAVWALGMEDPSLWTFLRRGAPASLPEAASLRSITFPFEVTYSGKGEILAVKSLPHNGARRIGVDTESGLVDECEYTAYATPYVLAKSGFKPKLLALTFDDGPDEEWTPQVLDELKRLDAPATFFVVGENAESVPWLVKRMVDDGHEIGSHTFLHPNLGTVGDARAQLELNLTQMAIEGITGRSTVLFRPPYNADSQPESVVEVRPVLVADKMGYVTVGENVDPLDWDLQVPTPEGGLRRKTAADIADFVVEDVQRRAGSDDEGNIILLHDAGGDRSATVKALGLLVPRLRSLGYRFVPVSTLMDRTRDQVMPVVPVQDRLNSWLGRVVLSGLFMLIRVLAVAFVFAIVIGIARSLLVVSLALVDRRRRSDPAVPWSGTVTILIAAYNEERVVVRTVESVLRNSWPVSQVIVVDDGSTDGTSRAITEQFGTDGRVVLLTKENGGKASALNVGLARAGGDVVVCIDADTQLGADAVGLLCAHFADERVAAVAGNVRVGNETNLLTIWQSIEYTTAQNIDRRAYGLLNAITVVPGAIGAWRRTSLLAVGGLQSDTLAEDMDLTWRLRMEGHRIVNEPRALAFTEAPDTFRAFFRQRFRWAYGTIQCLWKHRGALGRYEWFGRFALPSLWLFQVVFQMLGPLVDLGIVVSVVGALLSGLGPQGENTSVASGTALQNLAQVGFMYSLFYAVELLAAVVAFRMDRRPLASLWWLFLQRLVYRQMMYGVVFKAIGRALQGGRQGWGKQDRKGTVKAVH